METELPGPLLNDSQLGKNGIPTSDLFWYQIWTLFCDSWRATSDWMQTVFPDFYKHGLFKDVVTLHLVESHSPQEWQIAMLFGNKRKTFNGDCPTGITSTFLIAWRVSYRFLGQYRDLEKSRGLYVTVFILLLHAQFFHFIREYVLHFPLQLSLVFPATVISFLSSAFLKAFSVPHCIPLLDKTFHQAYK